MDQISSSQVISGDSVPAGSSLWVLLFWICCDIDAEGRKGENTLYPKEVKESGLRSQPFHEALSFALSLRAHAPQYPGSD